MPWVRGTLSAINNYIFKPIRTGICMSYLGPWRREAAELGN